MKIETKYAAIARVRMMVLVVLVVESGNLTEMRSGMSVVKRWV